jgi:hypothetical protein
MYVPMYVYSINVCMYARMHAHMCARARVWCVCTSGYIGTHQLSGYIGTHQYLQHVMLLHT